MENTELISIEQIISRQSLEKRIQTALRKRFQKVLKSESDWKKELSNLGYEQLISL